MIWSVSLLLLGILVIGLSFVQGDQLQRPAPASRCWLAFLAPAVFLAMSLSWLGTFDTTNRLRLALLGVGFLGEPNQPLEVTLGGDSAEHDVYVWQLPARVGNLPASLGKVSLVPPSRAFEGKRILVTREAGPLSGLLVPETGKPIESTDVSAGETIRYGKEAWVVGPALRVLTNGGEAYCLHRRFSKIPLVGVGLPIAKAYSPRRRTYPLSVLFPESTDPNLLGSFLFESNDGLSARRLALAAVDRGVVVEQGGESTKVERTAFLKNGERLSVMGFPRFDKSTEPIAIGPPGATASACSNREAGVFRSGGMRDFRSFRIHHGERALVFDFDRPEIHSLSLAEIDRLLFENDNDVESKRVRLSFGDWDLTDRGLYLRNVSRSVARESFAFVDLPSAWWPGGSSRSREARIQTPDGVKPLPLGEPIWMGERHLASIQVDLVSPPTVLAFIALLLAIFKAAVARDAGFSSPQLVIAAVVEGLAGLRLLLGHRAWSQDPYNYEAMQLALVAWVLLPWICITAMLTPSTRRPSRGGRSNMSASVGLGLNLAAGLSLVLVAIWLVDGWSKKAAVWTLCAILALSVPVGRVLRTRRFSTLGQRERDDKNAWIFAGKPWVIAASLVCALRTVLVVFGTTERLFFGSFALQLSILHIPAAIAIQAAYLVALWRTCHAARREPSWREHGSSSLLAALLWIVPSFVCGDIGLGLLGLPVFLTAYAGFAVSLRTALTPQVRRRRRLSVPWPPVLLLGAALLTIGTPFAARALVTVIPSSIEHRLASSRDYLRLLAFSYPKKFQRLAVLESEELAVMSAVMRGYHDKSGLWGLGYGSSEISVHLKSTALREHLVTVLLAAEWGLVGVGGVFLLYLSMLVTGQRLSPWHWPRYAAGRGDWNVEVASLCASLACMTFSICGVYMVLANYQAVLFTGKNPYLLGLDSAGDLMESAVLILIAAAGSAAVRRGPI